MDAALAVAHDLSSLELHVHAYLDFICAGLQIKDVCALTACSRTTLADLSSKALATPCARAWERFLPLCDTWGAISRDHLLLAAKRRGWRDLIRNLGSMQCLACGKYGSSFSVLAASRCCISCFQAKNSGEKGVDGTNPLLQCTLSWAKNQFLLTPAQTQALPQLVVDDAKKAHGLTHQQITLTLVEEARKSGIERWGSEEGIEAERSKRNEAAMQRYEKKVADFDISMSSSSSSSSETALALVRPKRPTLNKKNNWNFVSYCFYSF